MRRETDWFKLPDHYDVSELPFGVRFSGSKPTLHRTMLPLLPTDLQREIRALGPTWHAEVVDTATGNSNLRPYQQDAVRFARQREGSLIAFDMGCGKTRTALYTVHRADPHLGIVVAPKVTFPVWEKEIRLVFGPDWPVRRVRGRTAAAPGKLWEPGIYLINPELLLYRGGEWVGANAEWIVFDEAHYYTKGRTTRTQAAQNLAAHASRRVALTGTPIVRHATDLHGILGLVAHRAMGSWTAMARWLGMERGAYGWNLGTVREDRRLLLDARLSEIMIARRWEEVASDVPSIQHERVEVVMSSNVKREYLDIQRDVRNLLGATVTLQSLLAATKLVAMGKLRRIVGEAKVEAARDIYRIAQEPMVIWTWHRDVAEKIGRQFNSMHVSNVVVTGSESDKVRQSRIEQFQSGEAEAFIGTIAVGGVGIDLTRARIAVFAELDWTPANLAQAVARTYRSGQKRPCMVYWLGVKDTVEDRIVEILMQKAEHARTSIWSRDKSVTPVRDEDEIMISLLDAAMQEEDDDV